MLEKDYKIYSIKYQTLLNSSCEAFVSSKDKDSAIILLKIGLKERLNYHNKTWKKRSLDDFGFEINDINPSDYDSNKEGIISLGSCFPNI